MRTWESLGEALMTALDAVDQWQARWPAFEVDPTLEWDREAARRALRAFLQRLAESYPFFHPFYVGQMLKPPHPLAIVAYLASMFVNPNNHALDGGPATSYMEKEAVAAMAAMLGWDVYLGHLTGGGTVANLEALWVARESHPDKAVAVSRHAHYTHARACGLLKFPCLEIPVDAEGRMDLGALEDTLRQGRVGTVVLTLGTTGLGAVDPVATVVEWKERYGIRIHVDAAYGGFYCLLADDPDLGLAAADLRAITHADSVVIDPHKHGLQPYGCGAVLFRDPAVGRVYQHDSPYTYFTSDELHLGEISLECSRSGAAAAAWWFTLQVYPLTPTGLGSILKKCRFAALRAYNFLVQNPVLMPMHRPHLDIIVYSVRPQRAEQKRMSWLDDQNRRLFRDLMDRAPKVYVSTLKLEREWFQMNHPDIEPDRPHATVLRSVLMKPEHLHYIDSILSTIELRARQLRG